LSHHTANGMGRFFRRTRTALKFFNLGSDHEWNRKLG
jgi:hypothetical protein